MKHEIDKAKLQGTAFNRSMNNINKIGKDTENIAHGSVTGCLLQLGIFNFMLCQPFRAHRRK